MESSSQNLDKFDRSLSGLFNLLKTVIRSHEERKLNLSSSRKNPILTRLEKYIRIYDKTEPSEHSWYFDQIYNKHRPAILRGPHRDNWLKTGQIVVHFGKETGRPVREAKVHLSSIYSTACTLREDTEESIVGLPDTEQTPELLYPKIMLLHLYRLFFEICKSEEDKDKLSEHISELEEEAGVKHTRKSRGSGGDGMGDLIEMASDFMGQLGVELPKGQKLPSGTELKSVVKGMMDNPQTKSLLGNMMQTLQNSDNIGDVAGELLSNLSSGISPAGKKTLHENISKAVSQGDGQGDGQTDGQGEGDYLDDDFLD